MVREVLEIPIVGTVPAIKPAAGRTRTGKIALIGTKATIRQAYVDDLEAQFANGKLLHRLAAPGLVALAEDKLRGKPLDLAAVEEARAGLAAMERGEAIDTLVLACTHFSLLREELGAAFGPDVTLVDGADGIARRIAHLLEGQDIAASGPARFVVTGPVEAATGLGPCLAARGFSPPEAF
jgi:glutamate racemase